MAKVLKCGDLMPGCDTVIHGKDVDDVIGKAEDHARRAHNMTMIPPDVVDQIVTHIQDGPDEPRGRWGLGWLKRN
jgi:predicted small metal-binding protein